MRHSVALGARISGLTLVVPWASVCVCVCVCVCTLLVRSWIVWICLCGPNRSVIHLRHAARPLAPGGPLNCPVEGADLLHIRIGSWQVPLIWKEGGACLNRFDMSRGIYVAFILPLTYHELGAFFRVPSEWKGGLGILCYQLKSQQGWHPLGLCNGQGLGPAPGLLE